MEIKFKIGDFASNEKAFTQEDVNEFAKMTGDFNPIHTNESYAAMTIFKKPIVHGLLVAGLISALIAKEIPGEGSIYLGQNLKFKKPVFINEKVKAIIKIVDIRDDKPIFKLSTSVYNENGEIAIEGDAIVYYKGKYFV
jgi:acyl dehydratase